MTQVCTWWCMHISPQMSLANYRLHSVMHGKGLPKPLQQFLGCGHSAYRMATSFEALILLKSDQSLRHAREAACVGPVALERHKAADFGNLPEHFRRVSPAREECCQMWATTSIRFDSFKHILRVCKWQLRHIHPIKLRQVVSLLYKLHHGLHVAVYGRYAKNLSFS